MKIDLNHTAIITSRLNPLHINHIAFWKEVAYRTKGDIIICILLSHNDMCTSQKLNELKIDSRDPYESKSPWTLESEQNPLPLWCRIRLAQLAILNDPLLSKRATPLPRIHPAFGWKQSLQNLPDDRFWVFNPVKSEFDSTKKDYYIRKGEKVLSIKFSNIDNINGKRIRNDLKTGSKELNFLPEICRPYFEKECLKFFRGDLK